MGTLLPWRRSRFCLVPLALVAVVGLLWLGCRWGPGLRDESANRFAPAPPQLPFRDCPWEQPTPPAAFGEVEGRRVTEADWVPGAGGVLVTSGEDRFIDQALFFAETTGLLRPLPLPSDLRLPINQVLLVPRAEPLIVLAEAWSRGSELRRTVLGELADAPDHGDLVVMDFAGRQRARHRSAHYALLSPDFQWVAYWRSNRDGLHNLLVTKPEDEAAVYVGAITEADPGSGRSFVTCWSANSRYLHVSGDAFGRESFRWTYDAAARELYQDAG
jgi:hypothetical protein